MDSSFEYEAFSENKPSYVPTYVLSAFVLVALVSLAQWRVPLWPLQLAHLVLAIWFGVAFKWTLDNARQQKIYMSDRVTVTNTHFRHTFRYAVSEDTFVEIPLSEIEQVKVTIKLGSGLDLKLD